MRNLLARDGFWLILLTAVLFVASRPVWAQNRKIELRAGKSRLVAEIAATAASRDRGLSDRARLEENEGMVFVLDEPVRFCMWMLNTSFPLSVAFLDEQGIIINIEDMEPGTTSPHCAARPARYALEMNLGWFERARLKPGARIEGLQQAPADH